MVNKGYQDDDARIVDYKLWKLNGLLYRGPAPDLKAPYFSTLGAAQVFGRFTDRPFPAQLAQSLGMQVFNAGMSGAGPSFFLKRPELITLVNGGRMAIVHLMSGRSVSNRLLKVGDNQGTALKRTQPGARPQFAEEVYKSLLRESPAEDLIALREENRDVYVRQMVDLLRRITVPKIILYWSAREPEYGEDIGDIERYWGGFPHFVNRSVVEAIKPFADEYVECVTSAGLPQPLRDRESGTPIVMWPEDKFPHVKLRDHNYYYPSPEMHDIVATKLTPAAQSLVNASSARRVAVRPKRNVLIHLHIFKNAGSSFDASLKDSFGSSWRNADPERHDEVFSADQLAGFIAENPQLTAISSHQARFPLPIMPDVNLFPVVILRNPLTRIQSIYDYERTSWRSDTFNSVHTKMARELHFAAWVEWCLSEPGYAGPIANYQTRVCSMSRNGSDLADWEEAVTLANYQEASECLAQASVATVETYSLSMKRLEVTLSPRFAGLTLDLRVENGTVAEDKTTDRTTQGIRQLLGEQLYRRVIEANKFDLLLHSRYSV